ncbi:hypothetical protein ACFE04_003486 [Oxalis oulophora]
MGVDSEPTGKLQTTMTIASNKDSERVPQEPLDKPEQRLSNFEDRTMDTGDLSGEEARKSDVEDLGNDVTEQMNNDIHDIQVEAENGDLTEYSSSYGDTLSDDENGSIINDGEVDSTFTFDNALMSDYDEFGRTSQSGKKKVTDHWRKFIHPLMWRCKWIELQIKEMESRAQNYDRQAVEVDRENENVVRNCRSGSLNGAMSLSLCNQKQKQNSEVMVRRKRKQVEETINSSAYISNHNVFSYHEEKKLFAESPTINKCNGKFDIRPADDNAGVLLKNELSALEVTEADSSLVHILYKIDEMQSQARSLKTRVDKVVSENPTKFSSMNRLNLVMDPCDTFTSFDRNLASLNAEDKILVGSMYSSLQHVSDDSEDIFMPERANSSRGVGMQMGDRIVSADDLPELGSLCEPNEDVFLIQKTATKEELHNFERVLSKVTDRSQIFEEKPIIIPPVTAVKTESLSNDISEHDEDSPCNSRPFKRSKRQVDAKQKTGSDSWKLKLGSR